MRSNHRRAIVSAAGVQRVSPDLLEAIVLVESSDDPWAWNPEPQYKYLWDCRAQRPFRRLTPIEQHDERPPADFKSLAGDPDQEWWGQQASWGLTQILGAVARELGFRGPYLTELCHVETNLHFSALKLAQLMKWAGGDEAKACAAYNGGTLGNLMYPLRNQKYADKVMATKARLTEAT